MSWLSLNPISHPNADVIPHVHRRAEDSSPEFSCLHRALLRGALSLLLCFVLFGSAPAATFTVTSTADTGPGSLRFCMQDANGFAGPDIIEFAPGVTGTIHLTSPLPALLSPDGDGTEIRGETADDVLAGPDIIIDTSGAGGAGFVIQANACVIRGLEVENANIAVDVVGSMASMAQSNVIGGAAPREQNVLRSGVIGVRLLGDGAVSNIVVNNQIFSNSGSGIELRVGASFNSIESNFIFENNGDGILLLSDQAVDMHDNEIINNVVGLDPSGTGVLANMLSGIRLDGEIDPLYDNQVVQNVVAGNKLDGITVRGIKARNNTVALNHVGVDAAGTTALPNERHGVFVFEGAFDNVLGPGNVISANFGDGVRIEGMGSDRNSVEASIIGLDAPGGAGLGNGGNGVHLLGGAQDARVHDCVISANKANGVLIYGAGTDFHSVHDNFIGTGPGGFGAHPNGVAGQGGVLVWEGPTGCDVGPNNVVGSHGSIGQFGIKLLDASTSGHRVFDNVVGLDASQTNSLPNYDGIVDDGSPMNEIGPGNVVSGNVRWGVLVNDATDVSVVGNTIGTDAAQNTAFPNESGVYLSTGNCTVGGDPSAGLGNVICGNTAWGIEAHAGGSLFTGNVIQGNRIGENTSGVDMPNGDGGIWIGEGIRESLIGDPTNANLGNRILHNGPGSATFGQGVLVGDLGGGAQPRGIRILTNAISDNGTLGIELVAGANNGITPPNIVVSNTWQASGTTGLPGTISTVQVFHDGAEEGLTYLGETLSDAAGNWSLTFAVPAPATGNLTATNTAEWPVPSTVHTSEFSTPVAVDAVSDTRAERELPTTFSVDLSSANPTRGVASIAFAAPREAHLVARVFDVRGKLVREVANGALPAGVHQIVWDGMTSRGMPASSGRYFMDVRFDSRREVRRITLLR